MKEYITAHKLKIDPNHFSDIWCGLLTAQIRKNDRNFSVGDKLLLHETVYTAEEMSEKGRPLEYTGNVIVANVTHILKDIYSFPQDIVVMSIIVESYMHKSRY